MDDRLPGASRAKQARSSVRDDARSRGRPDRGAGTGAQEQGRGNKFAPAGSGRANPSARAGRAEPSVGARPELVTCHPADIPHARSRGPGPGPGRPARRTDVPACPPDRRAARRRAPSPRSSCPPRTRSPSRAGTGRSACMRPHFPPVPARSSRQTLTQLACSPCLAQERLARAGPGLPGQVTGLGPSGSSTAWILTARRKSVSDSNPFSIRWVGAALSVGRAVIVNSRLLVA